jgi:hypothetical protein
MIVKKSFLFNHEMFVKGDVYIVGRGVTNWQTKNCEYIPVLDFFKQYSYTEKGNFKKIIIRTGGIGDLIALSTICYTISGSITFVTQAKYFPVFNYFQQKVNVIDYRQPLVRNAGIKKLENIKKTYRLLNLSDAIENGGQENWYDVFRKSIKCKYELPKSPLFKCFERKTDNSLLISHRATASMRTAPLSVIYNAILKTPELDKYRPVKVNEFDITSLEDKAFVLEKDIQLEITRNITEYLNKLETPGMVISVDTGALHFREGLRLPAIGIYNAFTSACRTSGYHYTHSFDIKSNCDLQPCFLHENANGKHTKHCPKNELNKDFAPCFTPAFTPDIENQLIQGFKQSLATLNLS